MCLMKTLPDCFQECLEAILSKSKNINSFLSLCCSNQQKVIVHFCHWVRLNLNKDRWKMSSRILQISEDQIPGKILHAKEAKHEHKN